MRLPGITNRFGSIWSYICLRSHIILVTAFAASPTRNVSFKCCAMRPIKSTRPGLELPGLSTR